MNDRRTSLVAVAALLVLLIAAIALAPPADAGEGMERLCFACRDESNFIWGADLAFYTDERGTQTLRVDGGTGNIDAEGTLDLAGAMTVGGAVTFDGAAVFDGAVAMNSTLDVGGNVASDTGAFTITDQLFVDGVADAVQLTVQGYTTQTSDLFVAETYALTDLVTIDNSGNVYIDGKLDVSGSIWDSQNDLVLGDDVGITGTLDVNGAVADNDSALTVADNMIVDGAADAVQLTVQGYTTQTSSLLVLETSAGTDKLTVSNGGALWAAGGADVDGAALYLGADQGIYMDEVADGDYRFFMAAGTDVISYTTGNVAIGNGVPTYSQTGEDLYVEGMVEIDSVLYSDGNTYIGGNSYFSDNTVYMDSDSDITIAGSTNNLALTTVAAGTVQVAVGNLKVGDESPTVAQNGEDAYVEGQFEVDGEAQLDGALDANSTADFASTVAFNADTTMAAEATGGNAGARNEYIGLPRIKLAGIGVKDGAAEVEVDDSPAGEWSALTVSTTVTADTSYYKVGANALKIAWVANALVDSGATSAGPDGDWTGMKSIGFWLYADKAFEAAQLVLYLTDATDPATFNTCAYTTAAVWQYCEVDISSLAGTVGDAVTDIDVRMAAGLPVAINIYIDELVAWSAADEVSLGVELQQDGDLGFINATSGASLTAGADYAIAYRAGVDSIVIVADLDPDGAFGLVAY